MECRCLVVAAALVVSAANDARSQGTGTIVGVVTALETTIPLPGVDATLLPAGRATFGDVNGRFVFRDVAAGAVQVQVRRIGFTPVTVPVTVTAGRTDTVRVSLHTIALKLAQVRVSDDACGRRHAAPDTAVAAILQQVQINAERSRLFAEQYPFVMTMQRAIINDGMAPAAGASVRRMRTDTLRVDTVDVGGEHAWRYEPGKLIVPNGDGDLGARDKLIVPQLSDFADPAFVGAHCYRYAGLRANEGRRMIQVDFEPARGVPEPDVRGTLWLDTATFAIARSTLVLDRPSPLAAGDMWEVRVDTWFREMDGGHSVIDHIESRTTITATARGNALPGGAAIERQRLLEVRFLNGPP